MFSTSNTRIVKTSLCHSAEELRLVPSLLLCIERGIGSFNTRCFWVRTYNGVDFEVLGFAKD